MFKLLECCVSDESYDDVDATIEHVISSFDNVRIALNS